MKIPYLIGIGIAIVGIIALVGVTQSYDSTSENKIRVAFFPSIVHAVPIVGIENQTFANTLDDNMDDTLLILDTQYKIGGGADALTFDSSGETR